MLPTTRRRLRTLRLFCALRPGDALGLGTTLKRQPRSRRRVTDENRPVHVVGHSGWRHRPAGGGRGPDARGLVVSALFFFPRGGSVQVTRSLARALPAAGCERDVDFEIHVRAEEE